MVPFLEKMYLHREMVAMGVLTHLCLENDEAKDKRVAEFFAKVGLPFHLGQLSLDVKKNVSDLDLIFAAAMGVFFLHHEPFEVTKPKLKEALLKTHELGAEVSRQSGAEAYRNLHQA